MHPIDILLFIGLLFLLFVYTWSTQKLRNVVCESQHRASLPLLIVSTGVIALLMLAVLVRWIPLPVFYLLLYAASFLTRITTQEQNSWDLLFLNVQFLILAAPHLITVGVLALMNETDASGVLHHFTLSMLSLVIAFLLNILSVPILIRSFQHRQLHRIPWNLEELRLFSRFVWFCAWSVVFDSIPCLYPLPTIFPLIFLIGSNLLLLMMAFIFAWHVYTIVRDSHIKEEALRLQEEAISQHRLTLQLEQEAYLDVLTKIYTRPYALSNISSMLSSGETFALVFLDLDGLKQINDHQGHLAGDDYLQQFTAHMKERLRSNDIFARYGGDEFLVVMPDLTLDSAQQRMVQIQADASAIPPDGWGIPFSYGLVVALPNTGTCAEQLISMADQAMYEDKKNRRVNREGIQ